MPPEEIVVDTEAPTCVSSVTNIDDVKPPAEGMNLPPTSSPTRQPSQGEKVPPRFPRSARRRSKRLPESSRRRQRDSKISDNAEMTSLIRAQTEGEEGLKLTGVFDDESGEWDTQLPEPSPRRRDSKISDYAEMTSLIRAQTEGEEVLKLTGVFDDESEEWDTQADEDLRLKERALRRPSRSRSRERPHSPSHLLRSRSISADRMVEWRNRQKNATPTASGRDFSPRRPSRRSHRSTNNNLPALSSRVNASTAKARPATDSDSDYPFREKARIAHRAPAPPYATPDSYDPFNEKSNAAAPVMEDDWSDDDNSLIPVVPQRTTARALLDIESVPVGIPAEPAPGPQPGAVRVPGLGRLVRGELAATDQQSTDQLSSETDFLVEATLVEEGGSNMAQVESFDDERNSRHSNFDPLMPTPAEDPHVVVQAQKAGLSDYLQSRKLLCFIAGLIFLVVAAFVVVLVVLMTRLKKDNDTTPAPAPTDLIPVLTREPNIFNHQATETGNQTANTPTAAPSLAQLEPTMAPTSVDEEVAVNESSTVTLVDATNATDSLDDDSSSLLLENDDVQLNLNASDFIPTGDTLADNETELIRVPVRGNLSVSVPAFTLPALKNSSSPQYMALDWLANDPSLATMDEGRVQQLFSMVTFYYAFGGDDWAPSRKGDYLNRDKHECEWFGETVSRTSTCDKKNRVVSLFLKQGAARKDKMPVLEGTMPPQVALLSELKQILFNGLGYQGEMSNLVPPFEALKSLQRLADLSLQNQNIVGNLPMSQLLPVKDTLNILRLTDNSLSGSIPSQIGEFTNLSLLTFVNNKLSGTLPSQAGLLRVDRFKLSQNRLSGPLPTQIGLMTQANVVEISENLLNGALPSELGMMSSMTRLSLANNSLTGQIPSELALAMNLAQIDLSLNKLDPIESFPMEICNLPKLNSLKVDCMRNQCPCRNLRTCRCVNAEKPNKDDFDKFNNSFSGPQEDESEEP